MQRGQFDDVQLYSMLEEISDRSAVKLAKYSVPELKRISFEEAVNGVYEECSVGVEIGPTWSTHWFRVDITVPASMDGKKIALEFDPDCEAMIWSSDGVPLCGLTGGWGGERHVDFDLSISKKDEKLRLWIEVAANGLFGAGGGGMINPPDPNRRFRLSRADLVVYDPIAYGIYWDLQVLLGIAKEMPEDTQISNDALFCANEIVNAIRPPDRSSLLVAKGIGTKFFESHSHTGINSHEISAVGNCHIDTGFVV
jgi:alpha-mannosidase